MLELNGLHFRRGARTILAGVGLRLAAGEVACLLGENGAGKTTLLNVVTGYLRATGGQVRLGGKDLTRLAPFQVRRAGLARTFQDLRLVGGFSARENVRFALAGPASEGLWRGLTGRTIGGAHRDREEELLVAFGLTAVADTRASDLSYGQQKLLTLACCTAVPPHVLLLDEPVAGIAPAYRDRVAGLLAGWQADGRAVLVVEHQLEFVRRLRCPVYRLNDGALRRFETVDDFVADRARHGA